MFAKDTLNVHSFYRKWHENWLLQKQQHGVMLDQPPLFNTDIELGGFITELDNNYNAQVTSGVKYLVTGKILHFFNLGWCHSSIHPFLQKTYYKK
jgi:hypothetical protein